MAQHFAQRLVDHRNVSLAAQAIAKLPLHHTERGFDVRAGMVMGQKFLTLEHEVMEHLSERSASRSRCRTLERDKRGSTGLSDVIGVVRLP